MARAVLVLNISPQMGQLKDFTVSGIVKKRVICAGRKSWHCRGGIFI
jgi:hypothetical protein